MSRDLRPYTEALRKAEAVLQAKLASGRSSAGEIAVARRTWEIMASELKDSQGSVLAYERLPSDSRTGYTGPQRWYTYVNQRAKNEIFPHEASDATNEAYFKKRLEYITFSQSLIQSRKLRQESTKDRYTGLSYLIQDNPQVIRIMQLIQTEFLHWFEEYPVDREFYRRGWYMTWSAAAGYQLFLEERPDIRTLFRIAQTFPSDVEVSEVPIDRPLVVEAVELAIGLVPVIGNLVAAYEANAGVDMFGYRLTNLERGILGASVLLPIAGRLIKGGRAIYSEARLVSMYGRDAAAWSRTIRASSLASEKGAARKIIEKAEAEIRAHRTLNRALAQSSTTELSDLIRGATSVSMEVDPAVSDLFRQLSSRYKILHSLDELAFQRVVEKGPKLDHLKGQLLEELMAARVVPWLRDRAGSFALGVQTGGKQLEFIPGYIIRHFNGSQITDGILAYQDHGIIEIVAVFEAKSGKDAARELRFASKSISKFTKAERAELRAHAKDMHRELRDAAKDAGKPFKMKIEEIEREIIRKELGGQIRRDIERLFEMPQIRIGSNFVSIHISPTRTKFFGILPKDVNRSLIEHDLRECGFKFEIIGADISQRDLRSITSEMVPLATTIANAP